jgi:hypothetical protein
MQLKTFKQQLLEEKDRVMDSARFLDNERDELKRQRNREESRIFSDKGRIRVIEFQMKEYSRAVEHLWDYAHHLEGMIEAEREKERLPIADDTNIH